MRTLGIHTAVAMLMLWLCGASAAWGQPSNVDLVGALSAARTQGCNGRPGAAQLRPRVALDDAARRVAAGTPTSEALRQAVYRARSVFQANLSGYATPQAVVQAMAQRYCEALADPRFTDVGVFQRGSAYWILLAAPFEPPRAADASTVAARVLALVNQARATPRRCGNDLLEAAPPLQRNELLDRAAMAHARDMASYGFLEHRGSDGSSPGDRASRAGYRWRSVGENIASGQTNAEEVVAGWLRSPEHCENIMAPAFIDMGVAFVADTNLEAGVYWVQSFGRPR